VGSRGVSLEFSYVLPTWHENYISILHEITRSLVRYFPHRIPWGIKPGTLFCRIALVKFVGEGHSSKFTVQDEKCSFLQVEASLPWLKGRLEFETENK